MRTNKRHQMKYKGRLRTALLGFAALALAIVGISVGVSSASAADPYANLKASEFKWEKWWDQGGRAEAKPMTESTRLFLEQQGIRCEGGVCRPSGERPIPETLDLSGRDLRDVTFRDLVVTNMMTNATNLTNAKFENLQLNGTWNAVELLAKNMVVTGVGAGTSQVPTGRLEGTWTRSNVEGMRLSNLDLSNLAMDKVKARWTHVSESVINHESMHALVKSGVVQFPSNVIVEEDRRRAAESDGVPQGEPARGLLPEGRHEGLNLEGTRLEGSLRNVEFLNSNLTGLEVRVPQRPENAQWTKAWENVSVKGGFISDAKFDLHSSDRISLAALEQDNVSFTSHETSSNLRVEGRAMVLRLAGNYENVNLSGLKPEFTAAENLANLPHIVDQGQIREVSTGRAFLDLSNSRQVKFVAPSNISNSKLNNTEFVNTALPENLRAHNVEAHGMKFESTEQNTNSIGKNADFRGANFNAANLNGQRIRGANFSEATLTDVTMENAILDGNTSFDRAKVSGLNASNSEISNGSKLSALGAIWNKILKFFGFEPQSRAALDGSKFEGVIDFSNTNAKVLAGMNWRGVSFSPGTELVFKDSATTLEAMTKVMQGHSTNTVHNLSISFLDEAGYRVTLVLQGQSIEGMAARLTGLKVSQTLAEQFEGQLQEALRATEGATDHLATTQAGLTDSERGVAKAQTVLEVRESIVRQLTNDRATALDESRKYVERKSQELDGIKRYLETTGPQRIAELRQELSLVQEKVRFPDASDADRNRIIESVKNDISRERRNVSTARSELSELKLEQASNWPKNPWTQRAANIGANLRAAQKAVENGKAELATAQSHTEQWRADHATATKAHEEQTRKAREAKEYADVTKNAHETDVRDHHESLEKLPDDWRDLLSGEVIKLDADQRAARFDTAIAESGRQIAELKARSTVLESNLAKAEATLEKVKAELPHVKEVVTKNTERLPGLHDELDDAEDVMANLQARAQREVTNYDERIDRIKIELGPEVPALRRLEAERQSLIEKFESKRYRLATDIRGLQAEIRRTSSALEQAKTKVAELEHSEKQAERSKHEANAEAQKLRTEIANAEKTLETLKTNQAHTVKGQQDQLVKDAGDRAKQEAEARAERERAAEVLRRDKERILEKTAQEARNRALQEQERQRAQQEATQRLEEQQRARERAAHR